MYLSKPTEMIKIGLDKPRNTNLRQPSWRNQEDKFGPNTEYAKNKERHEALKKR